MPVRRSFKQIPLLLLFFVSIGLLMNCSLKMYCAPFLLLRKLSFSPLALNVSGSPRSRRGSIPCRSSKPIWCRPKFLALVTCITSQFINRFLGFSSECIVYDPKFMKVSLTTPVNILRSNFPNSFFKACYQSLTINRTSSL